MQFHVPTMKIGEKAASTVAPVRRPLFRKYAAILVGILSSALIVSGSLDIWFSYQEQKELLVRVQHEQAQAAAAKITQFINQIRSQMGWVALVSSPAETFEDWRFDVIRLLRQEPALTEVAQFTSSGREQFRFSRYARDVTDGHQDHSNDPLFTEARANEIAYGPVSFVDGSEPFMTIAMTAGRGEQGVLMGQVNLKFIWDIVSQIKAGERGQAYLVDGKGRLIAHPDLSLVLKNTDMSVLPQVESTKHNADESLQPVSVDGLDLNHRPVLSAHAPVPPLNWLVFVDVPREEAYAPLYGSVGRSALILAIALALALLVALLLARRMVGPIQALHSGAARIAVGDLTQRIAINTDDELEALGSQFNVMAERLHQSYATLEQKVEERTRQLELANQAKSRFLAAASHDLRQPLHALGLFVSQLRGRLRLEERKKIVGRIESSLSAMNQLFNALLDISKLEAGAVSTNVTAFPVSQLLQQVEATFGEAAREKGLALRIVKSGLWIRTDFILLQRIVFNLVSNAIRYTSSGTVLVGCRRRAGAVRIEVWDTGVGIAADQHQHIFTEFYRVGEPDRDRRAGIGLGLAIVDRLCRLLGHPIDLSSTPRRGTRFSITVPATAPAPQVSRGPRASQPSDSMDGKLVVVIDDDLAVLDSMAGLFKSWGCRVISAETHARAVAKLARVARAPDIIVSDYQLPGETTGVDVIEDLRSRASADIPAFLISGDTNPETHQRAKENGLYLLHKPVEPMALRAMFSLVLRKSTQKAQ